MVSGETYGETCLNELTGSTWKLNRCAGASVGEPAGWLSDSDQGAHVGEPAGWWNILRLFRSPGGIPGRPFWVGRPLKSMDCDEKERLFWGKGRTVQRNPQGSSR